METINDIISEMREFADVDAHTIGRDVLRRRIQHYARRIGEATAQCNQYKMRETLKRIHILLWDYLRHEILVESLCLRIKNEINTALSTPPRNCDCYPTLAVALEAWRDIDPREAGPFDDWLFAEAKGEEEDNNG